MRAPILVALLLLSPQVAAQSPVVVSRQASLAVEGDSARTVAARWERRLARDPGDRAAALGLASLARVQYDYANAERQLAALAGAPTPDGYAAQAAIGMAYGYGGRGLLAQAADWFQRARGIARAARDSASEAEAILGLAFSVAHGWDPAVVSGMLDSAARLIRADDIASQAMLRCRRASLLSLTHNPTARAEALAGANMARRAGESLTMQAGCLLTVASDFLSAGLMDSASSHMRTVIRLQRRARDLAGLSSSLQWWGYALAAVGRQGEALSYLSEAVVLGERSGTVATVGWASVSLAYIAITMGDLALAARHAARAAELLERTNQLEGAGMGRVVSAAVAAEAGDLDRADSVYAQNLAWARRTGRQWVEAQSWAGLVRIGILRGDWNAAQRYLDSSRAAHQRHGGTGWDGGDLASYATLALRRGLLDSAQAALDTALRQLTPGQHSRRYRVRTLRADLLLRRGEVRAATRELEEAMEALEAWRAALDDDALRMLVFQSEDPLGAPEYGVASVIAAMAREGQVDAALRLAEKRRARELRDRLVGSGASTPAARRRRPPALDAGIVSAALADDSTAILHYVAGKQREPTTLFVVRRGASARAYVLPPLDSLAAGVHRFAALAEGGTDAPAPAAALGAQLLAPALRELPAHVRRLVIVPDGVLHRLPFDALRIGRDSLVVDRFAVSLAPSVAVLAALRTAPRRGGAGRVLAFGDAAFARADTSGSAAAAGYRAAFAAHGGLPRLPASGGEARLAAGYGARGELRLGTAASEAYLRMAAARSSFDVVHLATHAVVDEWSMARTAIALAPGGGEDGFLGPSDLASLRLRASLVVLSACRTAGGVLVGGEGVRGLAAPLLEGGARVVVATQWNIGDRAASALVADFYRALAAGLTVGDALHRAKLAARQRGAPTNEWAAFTTLGDAATTLRLTAPAAAGARTGR